MYKHNILTVLFPIFILSSNVDKIEVFTCYAIGTIYTRRNLPPNQCVYNSNPCIHLNCKSKVQLFHQPSSLFVIRTLCVHRSTIFLTIQVFTLAPDNTGLVFCLVYGIDLIFMFFVYTSILLILVKIISNLDSFHKFAIQSFDIESNIIQ